MSMNKLLRPLVLLGFFLLAAPSAQAQYYNTSTKTEKPKCAATTNSGYGCSRNAKSGSNYCTQHGTKKINDDGYRYTSSCQAIAKSTGVQCRNKAKSGSSYCGTHNK
jgi:hypothetical protein